MPVQGHPLYSLYYPPHTGSVQPVQRVKMYSLQNFLAPKREIIWVVPTEVMECGEIRNFAGKKVRKPNYSECRGK
tara:strand:+ start:154 stop:378 length:225 start_codon:yes stop_codon:yes gene_type:complete